LINQNLAKVIYNIQVKNLVIIRKYNKFKIKDKIIFKNQNLLIKYKIY